MSLFLALSQRSVTHTKDFLYRAYPAPSSTCARTHNSAGSRTRPANAGTRNPHELTTTTTTTTTRWTLVYTRTYKKA